MESYASTAALLFATSAWAGFGYIDAEHPAHQALAALHAGGIRRYYIGKLLAGLLTVSVVPGPLAVIYPLAFDKFERTATAAEALTALLAHMAQAGLGFAVAAWFTRKLAARHGSALLGLFLTVSASLAAGSIASELPREAGWLTWLLTPVRQTMAFLTELDSGVHGAAGDWLAGIVWPGAYGMLLLAAFVLLMGRKRF